MPSPRALNRSLMARQGLLERSAASVPEMVERLVGMQAQVPGNPYVGLWSRLRGFEASALSSLIATGDAVRGHLMRTTVHLATARDHDALWPHAAARHAQLFRSTFEPRLHGAPVDRIVALGRELLEEGPRTKAQIGAALASAFPDAEPEALAYAVALHLPLVQAPPRGEWGVSAAARMALREPSGGASIEEMVRRYLDAFGPASVADIRVWSGLTGLREVVERMELVRIGDLYDVPDAPWPDPDTPVPVRLLPEFDNALLAHADRARVVPERVELPRGGTRGFVLVDGFVAAAWSFAGGEVTVHGDVGAGEEAAALAAFLSSAG